MHGRVRHKTLMFSPDLPLWLAFLVTGSAMTVMVIIRYFASSGLFAWMTQRLRPGLYAGQGKQIREEIRWSLVAAVFYGAPTGLIFWGWRHHGWTQMYVDAAEWPLWYIPVSIFVYLFAQDSWFYWTHRAMHWPRLFRIAHAVHHHSKPPTAWTAMSFHPVESLIGTIVIPVMVFIVPIHIGALGVVLAIATVMGVTNHMGWEIFPRRFVHSALGHWVITASHHERHHEEYRCNFGLYFRFWDHLCGTDRGFSRRFEKAGANA
jgi:sterol desaturase/sphingolipid hydroxylase (fatty acid hydroxylase superfamily)